ncbi:hypothetical protein V5799_030436 [Amblyomma americanum]|uniref:Uncharacterized protein n=1 Tax=Amblyomma americanum TaxID=6943 RepID=A0AAQ4ENI7_AMBAM
MDSTVSVFVVEGETQSGFQSQFDSQASTLSKEKTDEGSGFFSLATLVYCTFGVMSLLIITCMVAIFSWFLVEDFYHDIYHDVYHDADHEIYHDVDHDIYHTWPMFYERLPAPKRLPAAAAEFDR